MLLPYVLHMLHIPLFAPLAGSRKPAAPLTHLHCISRRMASAHRPPVASPMGETVTLKMVRGTGEGAVRLIRALN